MEISSENIAILSDRNIAVWGLSFGRSSFASPFNNLRTFSINELLDDSASASDERVLSRIILNEILAEKSGEMADEIIYSPPYYDNLGKGEIITIGLPIYDKNNAIFGSVGIDTGIFTRGIRTSTNLNFGIFDGRFDSYLFVTDLNGIIIYHPFKPFDENDIAVSIYDLENHPVFREQFNNSLSIFRAKQSGKCDTVLHQPCQNNFNLTYPSEKSFTLSMRFIFQCFSH